jgi:hypothetical protein
MTAQNLLKQGIALETIISATGLSRDEILALHAHLMPPSGREVAGEA